MFFCKPIVWLMGLYVDLSPVNVFAFLSSLKVDTVKPRYSAFQGTGQNYALY